MLKSITTCGNKERRMDMYNYRIGLDNEEINLVHEKKFTEEELLKICKKAPKYYHRLTAIYDELTRNYGFKSVKYEVFLGNSDIYPDD